MPTEFWISVGRLAVEDSLEGESPEISFHRTIYRDFLVRWHTTLRREPDGGMIDVFQTSIARV